MRTGMRTIGIIFALALLVVAGYFVYEAYLAPQPEEDEAPALGEPAVTEATVVSAEGQVVPQQRAQLALPLGGRVAEVLVDEGDEVAAGQPLLRLEAKELEAALSQAEAAVAQARAALLAAQAQLPVAEAGVDAAGMGVRAAEAQLALAQAEPRAEEVAVLQGQVAAAEAGIGQAAAERDLAVSGPSEAQIQAAEAELARAHAQAETLRVQYNQLILVQRIGGPEEEKMRVALQAAEEAAAAAQAAQDELLAGATAAQQRAANSGVGVMSAQRDIAQAQLDLLLADPRPEQIDVLEIQVAQAEVAVAQAETAVAQAEAAEAQAEASLAQAEAAQEAAQVALEKMTLAASMAGRVVDVAAEVGSVVAPGQPLVSLAAADGWVVQTIDLAELDVIKVGVGDAADVYIDALPEQVLRGRVTEIAGVSTVVRGSVTYPVTIELEETEGLPLRWGMTAFVDIAVGE